MKTILNPSELEWKSEPIPSPEVCHPDTRILIWEVYPNKSVYFCSLLAPVDEYWIVNGSGAAFPYNLWSSDDEYQIYWAWFKRF